MIENQVQSEDGQILILQVVIDDMKLDALIFMHQTIPAFSTNFIYNYIIFSKVF